MADNLLEGSKAHGKYENLEINIFLINYIIVLLQTDILNKKFLI